MDGSGENKNDLDPGQENIDQADVGNEPEGVERSFAPGDNVNEQNHDVVVEVKSSNAPERKCETSRAIYEHQSHLASMNHSTHRKQVGSSHQTRFNPTTDQIGILPSTMNNPVSRLAPPLPHTDPSTPSLNSSNASQLEVAEFVQTLPKQTASVLAQPTPEQTTTDRHLFPNSLQNPPTDSDVPETPSTAFLKQDCYPLRSRETCSSTALQLEGYSDPQATAAKVVNQDARTSDCSMTSTSEINNYTQHLPSTQTRPTVSDASSELVLGELSSGPHPQQDPSHLYAARGSALSSAHLEDGSVKSPIAAKVVNQGTRTSDDATQSTSEFSSHARQLTAAETPPTVSNISDGIHANASSNIERKRKNGDVNGSSGKVRKLRNKGICDVAGESSQQCSTSAGIENLARPIAKQRKVSKNSIRQQTRGESPQSMKSLSHGMGYISASDHSGVSGAASASASPDPLKHNLKRKLSDIEQRKILPKRSSTHFAMEHVSTSSQGKTLGVCALPENGQSTSRTASDAVPFDHAPAVPARANQQNPLSRDQLRVINALQPTDAHSEARVETTRSTPSAVQHLQVPHVLEIVFNPSERTESSGTYIFHPQYSAQTVSEFYLAVSTDMVQAGGNRIQDLRISYRALPETQGHPQYDVNDHLLRPDDAMIGKTFE